MRCHLQVAFVLWVDVYLKRQRRIKARVIGECHRVIVVSHNFQQRRMDSIGGLNVISYVCLLFPACEDRAKDCRVMLQIQS